MDNEEQSLNLIFENLKTKASLKQNVFRNIRKVFEQLKTEANKLALNLDEKIEEIDDSVEVELIDKSEFEFHIKVGSDILIFSLATNVITFQNEYAVMKSKYISDNPDRGYFGQIMIYNFMADTIKYNRLEDPGYLIARLIANFENHFYVEGVEPLNFLFTEIENNKISRQWLRLLVEKAILAAIDMDLIGPAYPDIQNTNLLTKMKNERPMGNGKKLGFQMKYMDKIN